MSEPIAAEFEDVQLALQICRNCADVTTLVKAIGQALASARAAGRNERDRQWRAAIQASIDEWHAIAKDDPDLSIFYDEQANDLIILLAQLPEAT